MMKCYFIKIWKLAVKKSCYTVKALIIWILQPKHFGIPPHSYFSLFLRAHVILWYFLWQISSSATIKTQVAGDFRYSLLHQYRVCSLLTKVHGISSDLTWLLGSRRSCVTSLAFHCELECLQWLRIQIPSLTCCEKQFNARALLSVGGGSKYTGYLHSWLCVKCRLEPAVAVSEKESFQNCIPIVSMTAVLYHAVK